MPAKPADTEQSAPPDTLRVLVNVRERPSWILIRTDGTAAYEQIAQPGFSQTFEASGRLFIKSGDAGAVTVEINGQDAGALGGAGEIVARRLHPEDARAEKHPAGSTKPPWEPETPTV